jgi:hypothetical protein
MARNVEQRLSYCLAHQDRPTDTRCAACLKPICEECTLVTEAGKFCGQDCYTKRLASAERVRLLAEEDERERVPRLIRRIVGVMLKILFFVLLYFLYTQLPVAWTAPITKGVKGFWKSVKGAF